MPLGVFAQMAATGETVAAAAADDVPFGADNVARMKIGHVGADFDDFAHKFMPDDQRDRDRLARPRIPVIHVQIRPANPRAVHPDQDIVNADPGLGHIFKPQARFRFLFDQCLHVSLPQMRLP